MREPVTNFYVLSLSTGKLREVDGWEGQEREEWEDEDLISVERVGGLLEIRDFDGELLVRCVREEDLIPLWDAAQA